MTKLRNTHIALSDNAREKLSATLNRALATTLDLQMQVKQAHWNIKGPWFFARHELFDKLADRLRGYTDEFAERANTLGAYSSGTIRLASENSALPEYDLQAVDGAAHMKTLVSRYETYDRMVRDALKETQELGDPATEDLYTEVLRATELDLWFLESHLQG